MTDTPLDTHEDSTEDSTQDAVEIQRQRAEAAEAREQEKDALLRRFVVLEAAREEAERQKLNFNPGALRDAYDLRAFDNVQIGGDGQPTGVTEALHDLVQARPYLVKPVAKAEAPDIDATRSGGSNRLDTPEAQASRRFLTRGF